MSSNRDLYKLALSLGLTLNLESLEVLSYCLVKASFLAIGIRIQNHLKNLIISIRRFHGLSLCSQIRNTSSDIRVDISKGLIRSLLIILNLDKVYMLGDSLVKRSDLAGGLSTVEVLQDYCVTRRRSLLGLRLQAEIGESSLYCLIHLGILLVVKRSRVDLSHMLDHCRVHLGQLSLVGKHVEE